MSRTLEARSALPLLLALALSGANVAVAAEEPASEPRPTPTAAPRATPLPSPAPVATLAPAPSATPGVTVPAVRPRRVPVLDRGVIELSHARPAASRWKGARISLSVRDAPLPEVLRSFARIAGVNLVLDPRVQGEVTVELKDVPWDQALYVILKTHGMAAEIDGNVWLITPR
jgi:type IV pilus assembly protein PilQ